LLKLGLTQYGQKQYPQAEATLRQVLQRYPGTDVARTAQDRLRSMQNAGSR
jgi:TolA-binding protein